MNTDKIKRINFDAKAQRKEKNQMNLELRNSGKEIYKMIAKLSFFPEFMSSRFEFLDFPTPFSSGVKIYSLHPC
jgi:hypothetical protein